MSLSVKQSLLIGLLLCTCLAVAWELSSLLFPSLRFVLPPLSQIAHRFTLQGDRLLYHSWITGREMVAGLLVALAVGLPLAWSMTLWPRVGAVLKPLLVLTQSIPMLALAPLMILWLGWTLSAVVVPVALMLFFPIALTTYQGLGSIPREQLDYFRLHCATPWQRFSKLLFPWALPQACAGLRIAASGAALGAVAGEWAGGQAGLGVLMLESRRAMDLELTFAALLCLIALSLAFFGLAAGIERTALRLRSTPGRSKLAPLFLPLLLFLGVMGMPGSTVPTGYRLVLDWLPNPNHIPLFVGMSKGFFANRGVPIDLLKMQNPGDGLSLLAAERADLAVTYMPHYLSATRAGFPLQVAGYLFKQPLNSFIFPKALGIHSPEDLNGRILGYTTDGIQSQFLEVMRQEAGLRPAAIRNVGFDLATALATQEVEVLYGVYWNIEGEQLKSLGIDVDHLEVTALGIAPYCELLLAVHNNREEIIAPFRLALQESIAYCQAHPAEAFALYAQAHPDKSATTLAWEERAWHSTFPLLAPNQEDDQAFWDHYLQWAHRWGLLD